MSKSDDDSSRESYETQIGESLCNMWADVIY